MQISKPFTREQVDALTAWQTGGGFHPFTCANRNDGNHPHEPEYGDHGVLRATEDGWICPYCDYKQDWAHDFMAMPSTDPLDTVLAIAASLDLHHTLKTPFPSGGTAGDHFLVRTAEFTYRDEDYWWFIVDVDLRGGHDDHTTPLALDKITHWARLPRLA